MMHKPYRQEDSHPVLAPTSDAQPLQPAFFLRTKLLPPRPAPALLPRPRLTERLLINLAYPVTLVTANAGSGKTTLVADFVRTHRQRFAWYQLDYTDADPLVFLGYLTYSIRQAVPGFGKATLSYLQQAASELVHQPERVVDVLLNEVVDCVEQQLVMVLDDYHHLGPQTAVHGVVDRLLAYLPDVLHIIIISRDMPPLALARLRTQASLATIDRTDLLFTGEETRELFRCVFDIELTPEQLAEYGKRTEGWITALQLVRQVAQRQRLARGGTPDAASTTDLVDILRQSEPDIFDYFAEEVFAAEPKEIQRFLLRISLLETIDLDACAALYAGVNSQLLLPALVRRNVFVTAVSDERGEEYRLHPLFRSFLQRHLQAELGRTEVAAEHSRAADYFLSSGRWEQALHHLRAAEEFARMAATIADKGGAWIATGAIALLDSFTEALPPAVLEAHPRALVHCAEVARLRGEYEKAQMLFHRAATLLREQSDPEGEAEAFHSLAAIARQSGDFAAAFAYLERSLALADERSLVRTKCGNTHGLCLMSQGDWIGAERAFRHALQSAENQGDAHYARVIAHNLGLPAMIRGDFSEALRWFRQMLRDKGASAPVPQEATAHLNVARCLLYRGDLAGCAEHLDSALECCQLFNLIPLRGEIFEAYGNLYRERGDAGRATEHYERAGRAYEEAGIDPTRRELLEEQALLQLQMGDATAARALLNRLTDARAAAKDEMGYHTAVLTSARVMLVQNEATAALPMLEAALAYFRQHGLYYYEAHASMALASCNLAMGRDGKEMLSHLRRAIEIAMRYDYDYWLQQNIGRHPLLFTSAEAAALLPLDIRAQLPATTAQCRLRPTPPTLNALAKLSADLTINLLGPIEIFRDPARPITPDAWITKRSRDILCFIASHRHRRASKDVIINTFWGEADFATVEKNFHPTISHIRKALNSNQPLKQNFLLYRDGDYLLNLDFSYRIDIEEFDRLVAEGETARRTGEPKRFVASYKEAVTLYRGEFMHGYFDEWATGQRSYYREQYLRVLETLATTAQKEQDWARSLDLAQQILREDSFREDVHCMLMRAQAALGNRVAVKEQYETLRRLLHEELGVEPAAETRKIYQALIA